MMEHEEEKREGFQIEFVMGISPETREKMARLNIGCREKELLFTSSKTISSIYLRPLHRQVLVRLLRSLGLWVDIEALGFINNPEDYDDALDELSSNRQISATLSKIGKYVTGEYRLEKRKLKGQLEQVRLVKIER